MDRKKGKRNVPTVTPTTVTPKPAKKQKVVSSSSKSSSKKSVKKNISFDDSMAVDSEEENSTDLTYNQPQVLTSNKEGQEDDKEELMVEDEDININIIMNVIYSINPLFIGNLPLQGSMTHIRYIYTRIYIRLYFILLCVL